MGKKAKSAPTFLLNGKTQHCDAADLDKLSEQRKLLDGTSVYDLDRKLVFYGRCII